MKFQFALVLLFCASGFAAKARYDNYKLISLKLEDAEQFEAMQELEKTSDSYDFWSAIRLDREVDIMVPPHKFGEFDEMMTRLSINHYTKVENVQTLVDQQDPELARDRNSVNSVDWLRFSTYAEINAWLDGMVSAHDSLTNIIYGTSHEGRPLRAVRYSARAGNPAIFVEANIHAREWTSSATATWLINELCTSNDPATREMANSIDWYIIPVANPDGFVFSHESTRMWRKNRRRTNVLCVGTDPNRNFDFFWMQGGASNNPCSDTYAGDSPFSEPETAAIRDFYGTLAARTRIFLSFHAFGQYLLMPYGHTTSQSTNHANLLSVATAAANAITATFGSDYVVGSTADVLYVASGSSPDWAFGVHNTRLAYTFEFRDRRGGSNGFLLPPDQIIPNNQEVMNGLKALVAQARAIGQL